MLLAPSAREEHEGERNMRGGGEEHDAGEEEGDAKQKPPGLPGVVVRSAGSGLVALALHALAHQLAGPADGVGALAGAALGGLLVIAAELHFAEDPFALHFLLQDAQRLIDVVFTNENLHFDRFLPYVRGRPGTAPGAIMRRRRYHRAEPLERGVEAPVGHHISLMSAENTPETPPAGDPHAPLPAPLPPAIAAAPAFDGWTRGALSAAARQLALPAGEADRLFPGGPGQVPSHVSGPARLRTGADLRYGGG